MSKKAKEVVNAIKKYNYDRAVIALMNPNDLSETSKSDFASYTEVRRIYFIAEKAIERGTVITLHEDSAVKKAVYDFIKEHPEKEWRWKE